MAQLIHAHGFTLSARPNLGAAFRLVASNCRVCVNVVFGWMSVWYSNDAMPATDHARLYGNRPQLRPRGERPLWGHIIVLFSRSAAVLSSSATATATQEQEAAILC